MRFHETTVVRRPDSYQLLTCVSLAGTERTDAAARRGDRRRRSAGGANSEEWRRSQQKRAKGTCAIPVPAGAQQSMAIIDRQF